MIGVMCPPVALPIFTTQFMKSHAMSELETPNGERIAVHASPCLIGRAHDARIRLPLPDVSRRHAVLTAAAGEWWLMDVGSKDGTWLNGRRLIRAEKVVQGDVIGLGGMRLTFHTGLDPEADLAIRYSHLESTHPGEAEWLVTSGVLASWVNSACEILGGSPDAIAWLTAFCGEFDRKLPRPLCEWLENPASERIPYETRIGDQRLRISVCRMAGHERLLILSRLESAFTLESIRRLGFTRAEAAVIPWLVRGRRNDEIATILGIASKTTEKHVAKILNKLEVETRTAAAWNILERSGAHR
jgi:DNA-binding CsgD family transcriptional regulator